MSFCQSVSVYWQAFASALAGNALERANREGAQEIPEWMWHAFAAMYIWLPGGRNMMISDRQQHLEALKQICKDTIWPRGRDGADLSRSC